MKITPDNHAEMNATRKIDTQSPTLVGSDRLIPDAISEKSGFASVLDRVTRSHNEQGKSEDGKSANNTENRDTKTSEDDRVTDEVNLANVERPVTRETVAVDETNTSRPVLHSVDLNSIVTACHVQLAQNGQHEVTLELSRSMLDGLRVKLTSDGAGRVTADFLAATEGVKALLDGRSQELIDQLRARGVNLTEFRSSVAADPNSRNDSRENQSSERSDGKIEAVASTNETESTTATEDSLAAGATYRA